MTKLDKAVSGEEHTATVTVSASRISLVWLIPLVAALVGAWLALKTYSEQGPQVQISFQTAEGLEAGKTLVRYKEVVVGQVEDITLSENLAQVVVTARLKREVEDYLTARTRFWVERARITAGNVRALNTLLSGAYITMDPVLEGEPTREFLGLEQPPIVTTDEAGRNFLLQAPGLGSLNIGSPVYYRQIEVGQVIDYEMTMQTQEVRIQVFVKTPYDEQVRANTRFWNASGVNFRLTAEGAVLNTESLVSILIGGIAFDTPHNLEPGGQVEENHEFALFRNREASKQPAYGKRSRYLLFFSGSVRGLSIGAPVEFRGIKIGEVLDFKLEYYPDVAKFLIPVLIEIESERMTILGGELSEAESETAVDELVVRGLRAQLKSGSLITGQVYVDLDFHTGAEAAKMDRSGQYPVLPTVPAPFEAITASARAILTKIEQLPLEEIGADLRQAVQSANLLLSSGELTEAVAALNQTLQEAQKFMGDLNSGIAPKMQATLNQANKTLASAEHVISPQSALYKELKKLLRELSTAARSIRAMADYLERHPDALIYGKGRKK